MSSEPNGPFGEFEVVMRDNQLPPVKYNRLAIGPGQVVMLLSFVAGSTLTRAIRAVLSNPARGTYLNAAGGRVKQPEADDYWLRQPGNCYPSQAGYFYYSVKLDYHQHHVLAVSKDESFMPVVNEIALWWMLKQDRFTTPLCREWTPWLEKKLREDGHLSSCSCFNCNCATLSVTVSRLDRIVSQGIRDANLLIPDPPAKSVEWARRAATKRSAPATA